MTASATASLSAEERQALDTWWRAANYQSAGQIYLLDNPLLRERLRPERAYTREFGDDPPDVRDWVWPGSGGGMPTSSGGASATSADM